MLRIGRLLLVWVALGVLSVLSFHPTQTTPPLLTVGFLVLLLAAILLGSFGVLEEANALAARLGEPYGSLILTISVLIIEVVLIGAVMLGPTPAPTIGRDSIYSVMMIIMNLVVGAAIVLGALRNGRQSFNPRGTRIYLWMIAAFGLIAFVGPRAFIPYSGAFPRMWGATLGAAVGFVYIVFLWLQMGRLKTAFQDSEDRNEVEDEGERLTHAPAPPSFITSIPARGTILVLLLVAITLMSSHLGVIIDFGIQEVGLPDALGGLLIAAIVFTPETLTALQAARNNQMQRVVNLCLGAFVSTIGMSFPAVVFLGLLTGKVVIFGLDALGIALFMATVVLSALTFRGRSTSAGYGAAHLALFGVFTVTVFAG